MFCSGDKRCGHRKGVNVEDLFVIDVKRKRTIQIKKSIQIKKINKNKNINYYMYFINNNKLLIISYVNNNLTSAALNLGEYMYTIQCIQCIQCVPYSV